MNFRSRLPCRVMDSYMLCYQVQEFEMTSHRWDPCFLQIPFPYKQNELCGAAMTGLLDLGLRV